MKPRQIFRIIVFSFISFYRNTAQSDGSCNSPLTSDLRNDQFSASSEYNTKHNASAARQNGEGWSASNYGSFEYLKVDLESAWELTALDVQDAKTDSRSRTFRISYSNDGYVWTGYNTRSSVDPFGELFDRKDTITKITFDPTIKARYIVINPVAATFSYASARIELYGCRSSDASTTRFTRIGKDIEVDTTWSPSQSPILIDGPVAIRSSIVLTVQAGVAVIFTKESAGMNVYGTLLAEGIQGQTAIFSSSHPLLSARSKWQGIIQGAGGSINMTHVLIRQAVTGVQGNGSSVKLAYSEIYSCEDGVMLSGGIDHNVSNIDMIQTDDMIFTHINVHDNRFGLIVHADISKPDVPIEYSKFERNGDYGIGVINWIGADTDYVKTNLYILNCSMSNNAAYGIVSLDRFVSNFYIRNSLFVGNRETGLYYFRKYPSMTKETLNISNSHFIENGNDGVYIYCLNCEPTAHLFENNLFSGHTEEAMDVTLNMRPTDQTTSITVSNNTFSRNQRDIQMYLENNGRAFIENNYFTKSQIPVKLASGDINTNFAHMSGNVFTEHASIDDDSIIELTEISTNIINTTFENSSIQTIVKFNNGFNHSFEYNRFVNTSMTSCYLSVGQGYDPNNSLNIDNNYWGTSDMLAVKSKVCDFFFDSSKAIAELKTFFPTIMQQEATSASQIDDFRFENGAASNATIIGGIIKNSIDLASVGDGPFIVNRSLLIADSASMTIMDARIYFMNGRGLNVHGILTVGKGHNSLGRTILQAHADSSWNGIDLYSEEITMNNVDLFGTQRFLFVHGTNAKISFQNCNMTEDTLGNLIFANMLNGNISVSIRNSLVKSAVSSIYLKANDSRKIDIELTGSELSSGGYVMELLESTTRNDLRYVNLNISKCFMNSNRSHTLSLSGCSSHLAGTISGSNFSSNMALFQSPSMDLNITGNSFGDGYEIISFRFCNQPKEPTNQPKVINITRNVFNGSNHGVDIVFYKYYTNEKSHEIYVTNNVFGSKEVSTRRRINSYGFVRKWDDKHFVIVDSNLFTNSTGLVIGLTAAYSSVIITNNTFENNSQCIYITSQYSMGAVNITKNVFINNTLTNGVIFLYQIINNNTNIIGNNFVNNTNTVIAFRYPNTTIRHNFFENGEDVYNLLVLSDDNYQDKIVNASLNFWGTTDVKAIAKTIYDKDYDETLLDVVFRPYLGSRNITDIRDKETSFVSPDGEIGGTVNGQVTLNIGQSPFLVVSNIEIGETDTLTVEAGVMLIVKTGVGIKVNGQINILGTEENPVQMLPEVKGVPWRGIEIRAIKDSSLRYLHLNDTQEGLKIKSSRVFILNITSTYARQSGISVDVQDDKGSGQPNVKLSEVFLENNGWDGIHLFGDSENVVKITVDKCAIGNNVKYGIHVETNAEIYFKNCLIRNNGKGVYIKQSGSGIVYINDSVITNNSDSAITGQLTGGLVINSCTITAHNNGYITAWGYWSTSYYVYITTPTVNIDDTLVEFSNISFIDNIADGIYISKPYYGNKKLFVNIEKCTFSGGNKTLILNDNTDSKYSWNHIYIKFVDNIVENNILSYRSYDPRLIRLDLDKYYQVQIEGNTFRNNTGGYGFHISKSWSIYEGNFTIVENRFIDNNFTVSTIDVRSNFKLKFYKNTFITKTYHDCILTAPRLYDISYMLNATYNYWGTTSAQRVVRMVCSFDKNMEKSFVWYLPFYTDEDLIQTVSARQDTFNVSGSFGGEITGVVTLSKSEFPSPIRIDRSIMIREGASLNVEAGLVLQFEENRGIYVQGSLKLFGGESSIVLENSPVGSNWYGVLINSSLQADEDKSVIYNSRLENMVYGVTLYSQNVEIKGSEIVTSTSHCLTLYPSSQHRTYDFGFSKLEKCAEHGIYIAGGGIIAVTNVIINVTKYGIGLFTSQGSLDIRSVNISECRDKAVYVSFTDYTHSGNVTIENCTFSNCFKGVAISTTNYVDHNIIKVSRNTFINISRKALDVVLPSYRYNYANSTTNRTVHINLNVFNNSCGVAVETWNNVNLTFHDNLFSNAICPDDPSCFLNAYANGNNRYTAKRQFEISANLFRNIKCKCLVQLKDRSLPNLVGNFVYNQMLDIRASEAVIALNALYINVSANIFDNPNTSFDVYGYKRGSHSVNVTKNWLGSSDADQVYDRIFGRFIVEPVLPELIKDCDICLIPNRCRCDSGLCECEGEKWSGYLCDRCSETFYGPECLPLIKVLHIVPNQGPDKGGHPVHVWGYNFPNTDTYTCKFGTTETTGTWFAWNHVVCQVPQLNEVMVNLEVSPDGVEFTNDKLMYFYYASCPLRSCLRNFSPPHDHCIFGECSCFLPWIGENCDRELLAPVIINPALEQTVEEGRSYSLQLTIEKGSPPISWSLLKGPSGMTVNERTGLVSWEYAFAKSTAYNIEARARNIIGNDTVMWTLNVTTSYSVAVESIEPSGIFSVPRAVEIYGRVTFWNMTSQTVPVEIIVTSARTGRVTVLQELSDPLAPNAFNATYYPMPDDAGVFIANVRHPGTTSSSGPNITWSVLGMRCEPASVSVNENILTDDRIVTINGISSLINVGNGLIQDISVKIEGMPGAFIRKSADLENSQVVLPNLAINDTIEFDLVITNAKPLSGTLYVVFSTAEGTSTRLKVKLQLTIQKPVLNFDPPSFRGTIVRGTIRVFDFKVNNTGEVAAKGAVVSLPSDPRLTLVSFAVLGFESTSDGEITIPSGGSALLSIAITTEETAALGDIDGNIHINSGLTTASVSYRFFITSLKQFNVTFTVKDEYSYFAVGSPLVGNANVTLLNPGRGYSETKITTNETGYVVFEDVYEDQYTLYVGADGHSLYGAVVLVTPDTAEQDIFLQRIAVKYTWTVEPTAIEDVYVTNVEATFETNVPMPVVGIEPVKVNTVPLELGETDTVDFKVTNYGLIRADNVRFTLPTDHPYLNFELTVDFIGSVDANTSIIVPVKATLKNGVTIKTAVLTVCGLALLYDYDCGGTQTRGLDVTLTREYPGKPPLPCGLGAGGSKDAGVGEGGGGGGGVYNSGGGSGIGSGSLMIYNPITPLPCDRGKTLIESCALTFHPIAGCPIAAADPGASSSRTGGDLGLGTLNATLGLADTAFACVFGVACSLCDQFYTAIRCVIDVAYNCDGAGRRPEIGSDGVNDMLTVAKPMDNFLYMMTKILGDIAMYNIETAWYTVFKKSVGDDSELGTLLSNDEATYVLDTFTDHTSRTNLSRFLDRWNQTVAAWENGTLTEIKDTSRVISLTRLTPRIKQYLNDVESAAAKGLDSIFDAFDHATNVYKTAEQQQNTDSGGTHKDKCVCARVRMRIIQGLVLTGDAFTARLEIENSERSYLELIQVEIEIKQTFGTGELANDNFSIGNLTLIGISGVDGTGTLGDLAGSAEWRIIPYSNATLEGDNQYDIGGRLSYSVDGLEFSAPILPGTITVKPIQSLVVHYFLERFIGGDDVLTTGIEPIVPFCLAVLVMNNGYGVARALRITSGQPEIIENEKGLLMPFKIIGAQLGNNTISPSLAVNFGDILSFKTKTAKWLMTSTLMGTFINYSATFEDINPYGYPQLPWLDDVRYHELTHLVRIEFPEPDDGLDDFLVNDLVDDEGMPDKLYNSANGTDIVDVYTANITYVQMIVYDSSKNYKYVTLTVKTNTSVWFYARRENTDPDPAMKEHLLFAESSDGRTLLVDKNIWQAIHIRGAFYLHLLDFVAAKTSSDETSKTVEVDYFLIYGPRNMYAPRFNESFYSATVFKSRVIGYEIITIDAHDIDKDRIEFKFRNQNITVFNIRARSESSAVITVNKSPMEPGLMILEVIAKDSGIPPRSAYINVTIRVTETDITDTTPATTYRVTESYITDTTPATTDRVTETDITDTTPATTNLVTETDITDTSTATTDRVTEIDTTVTTVTELVSSISTPTDATTNSTATLPKTAKTTANITNITITTGAISTASTSKNIVSTSISNTMSTTEGDSSQVSSSTNITIGIVVLYMLVVFTVFANSL